MLEASLEDVGQGLEDALSGKGSPVARRHGVVRVQEDEDGPRGEKLLLGVVARPNDEEQRFHESVVALREALGVLRGRLGVERSPQRGEVAIVAAVVGDSRDDDREDPLLDHAGAVLFAVAGEGAEGSSELVELGLLAVDVEHGDERADAARAPDEVAVFSLEDAVVQAAEVGNFGCGSRALGVVAGLAREEVDERGGVDGTVHGVVVLRSGLSGGFRVDENVGGV
mmetsp:Transcript_7009/g.21383  ORF Transcript_7009/g.21383 Transcript_7009/m.21383 type:complete len:226 (+) Transcript_7009:1567-2244(+)